MSNAQPLKRYLVTIGDHAWQVDHTGLIGITHRGMIAQLPWPTPGLLGLIASEHGIVPLLTLGPAAHADDNLSGNTATTAILRLPTGLVAVDVDGIREAVGDNATSDLADFIEPLNTLTASFCPVALGCSPVVASPSRRSARQETFLRARSGDIHIAIPARRISRLEKHLGLRPLKPNQHLDWVVRLDADLLYAQSLGASYHTQVTANHEPWCLCLDVATQARGLLVEEIVGLVEVDRSQIKQLQCPDGLKTWLMLADEAPVEVFADSEVSPSPLPESTFAPINNPDRQGHFANLGNSVTTYALPQQLIRLVVGPHRLVIPNTILVEILGRLDSAEIKANRSTGDLPVIDLGKALCGAAALPCNFAVMVKIGRQKFVALVDNAETTPAQPAFPPPPSLPSTIFPYLEGIRLLNDCCELLLKEKFSRRDWRVLARSIPQDAQAGWMAAPI